MSRPLFLGILGTVASFGGPNAHACDPGATAAAITAAEDALRALDEASYDDALSQARAGLACAPDREAAVLRLEGIAAVSRRDTDAALVAFRAARALDPWGLLPDAVPPNHYAAQLYAMGSAAAPTPALPDPPEPTSSRRSSRPRLGVPLVLGGAAGGALAGGLYHLATLTEAQATLSAQTGLGADTRQALADQAGYTSRITMLQASSGGIALLSVGLIGAGLLVVW